MLCHCFQYRRRKSEIKERTGRIIKFTLNVREAKAIYVESILVYVVWFIWTFNDSQKIEEMEALWISRKSLDKCVESGFAEMDLQVFLS